jgi:hypothetical protein
MKNLRFALPLLVASLTALLPATQAALVTLDYDGELRNTAGTVMDDGVGYTQTFSGVQTIKDITFRFVAPDDLTFGPVAIDAYFNSWSGNNADGLESYFLGGLQLGDFSAWDATAGNGFMFFDANFSLASFTLDIAKTYGLTFVGNSDTLTNSISLAGGDNLTPYAGGGTFEHANANNLGSGGFAGPSFSFLATDSNSFASLNVTPIPEAGTAAVLFAGLFVGLMLTRRQYRPRSTAVSVA